MFLSQFIDLHQNIFCVFDHFFQLIVGSDCKIATLVHNSDTGTDLFHFLHVVGSIDNSCPTSVQFHDAFQNLVTALRIDSNRRLIHNDQFRFVSNATGDIQTAKKTTGQLLWIKFLEIFQSNKTDGILYQFFPFFFIFHIKSTEIVNVFIYSQLIKYGNILHNYTNITFAFIAVRLHSFSKDFNTSLIIGQQGQQTVYGRCFSRAVWSQQTKDFALGNFQIEMIKSQQLIIAFYKIFNFYYRCVHKIPPLSDYAMSVTKTAVMEKCQVS